MKSAAYYKAIYEKIVNRAKTRDSIVGYIENHHIIPRCMGGTDERENIVALTPEEHYVCHQLLVKIYPNHVGLWRAVYIMTYTTKSNSGRKGNKMYGWLKRKNKWKPKVVTNCHYCEKEIVALECLNRKFCNTKCKYKSMKKEVKKKCLHCSSDFFVTPTNNHRKFCTPKCAKLSRIKTSNKKCLNCETLFQAQPNEIKKRVFCSHACVNAYRKGKPRAVAERVSMSSKPCNHCGKFIHGKPGKLKQKKYCSRACAAKGRCIK
jgi:hypothetical protein